MDSAPPPPRRTQEILDRNSEQRRKKQKDLHAKAFTNGSTAANGQVSSVSGWNPPSKTALGRLTYELGKMPDLFVVDVRVQEVKDEKSREDIQSTRLRKKALQALLREHEKLKQIDTNIVGIHPWAGEGLLSSGTTKGDRDKMKKKKLPIDHLIIPASAVPEGVNLDNIFFDLKVDKHVPIKGEKKQASRSDKSEKNSEDKKLSCEFLSKGKILHPANALYRKSIDVLVRTYITQKLVSQDRSVPLSREYLEAFTGKHKTPVGGEFDIWLRYDPKIEFSSGKAALHLDYDLVPTVRKQQLVSHLLEQIYGTVLFASGSPIPMAQIKQMLCRMEVIRVDGTPEIQTTSKRGHLPDVSPLVTGRNTQGRVFGERYTIKDVKMPSDVAPFYLNDGEEHVKVTVVKYFEMEGHKLKHPKFPLANIGKTEPGREVWIPVELLKFSDVRVLKTANHLAVEMQAQQVLFFKEDKAEELLKYSGKEFLGVDHMDKVLPCPNNGTFLRARSSLQCPEQQLDSRDQLRRSGNTSSFGILYFAASDGKTRQEGTTEIPIIAKINPWIKEHNDIIGLGAATVAQISDVRSLLVAEQRQKGEVRPLLASTVQILLAIIDTKGRSDSEVDYIRAEINKFGDKQLGAITVTTTKQSLEEMMAAREGFSDNPEKNEMLKKGSPKINPLKPLLYKMRYMRGEQNFEDRPDFLANLNVTKEQTMIAGAYLSHPGAGAADHCPSVAALVATTSKSLHQFFGSARIQPTLRESKFEERIKGFDGKLKHTTQSRLVEVETMMAQRVQEWSPHDKKSPGEVILYRHGLPLSACRTIEDSELDASKLDAGNENDIAALEIRDIKKAVSTAKITYIAVLSNSTKPADAPKFFTTAEHEKHDILAKHRYMILYSNKEGRTEADLRKLTRDLNTSSQLGSPVSLALPCHFARKLSHRMYSYFHPFLTRDLSHLSGLIRQTPEISNHAKNDESMARDIAHYVFNGNLTIEMMEQPVVEEKQMNGVSNKEKAGALQAHSGNTKGGQRKMSSGVDANKQEMGEKGEMMVTPWHRNLRRTMFYL